MEEINSVFSTPDKRCLIVNGVLDSFAPAGITEYLIPVGVTEIGGHAMSRFNNLTKISIPEGVTKIGEYAFSTTGLKDVIIPESVTTIEFWAFDFCPISQIIIPRNVKDIYDNAFNYCYSLKEVYFKPEVPPTLWDGDWNPFGVWPKPTTIYVPMESVDAYKERLPHDTSRIVGYDYNNDI